MAQRLHYGMSLPPPPIGRQAGMAVHARAVGVLAAERPRIPCPPAGPGKQSGCRDGHGVWCWVLGVRQVMLYEQQVVIAVVCVTAWCCSSMSIDCFASVLSVLSAEPLHGPEL